MNYVLLSLFLAAICLIQALIGGTRLLFALPAYGILAVAAGLSLFRLSKGKPLPSLWCLASTVILAAYIAVRAHLSPVPYLAWPDYYMVIACVLTYLLTCFHVVSTRDRLVVVAVLLAIALVHVGVGIVQFTQRNGFMFFGFIRGDTGQRASGMFISPNHFAGYLEVVGIMAISLLWWGRWPLWAKALAGYAAAMCLLGVAVSGSRGGYLSTISALLFFALASLWVVKKTRKKAFVRVALLMGAFVLLSVCGAVGLMLNSPYLQERMTQVFAHDVRFYNWQAALDQWRASPVVGTGAGTHLYYGRLYRRPQIQRDPVHAHGDYLELLAEYGVVGAAAMGLFLAAHLTVGVRGLRGMLNRGARVNALPRSHKLALALGSLSAVAAYLVHSVVDFNLHIPGNALLMAFVFGMLANPATDEASPSPAMERVALLPRLGLPVLGLWLLFTGVLSPAPWKRFDQLGWEALFSQLLRGEYYGEKARVALRDRDIVKCREYSQLALEAEQQNPNIHFHAGEAERMQASVYRVRMQKRAPLLKAVSHYENALAAFPHDEHTLVRLAQSLDALGEYDRAEECYLEAISWDPNLGVLYAYYAEHLKLLGLEEQAAEVARRAAELGASSVEPPVSPGSREELDRQQ